ncbi:flavodoxin [Limosilactobacillus fermentum]|nr:flavodoxin [Limosilactobacillus fermentum]
MATTLVLYFSASGTTKRMAQTITNLTGADLHEIKAQDPYTQADLDWHNPQSRTSIEQHEHRGHVACVNDFPALDQYDTIIIGHPIWWGIPPRLIANAIDQLPLDGKTLVTFATSEGSGYQRSQSYIQRVVDQTHHQVTIIPGTVLSNQRQAKQWLTKANLI